MMAEGDNNQLLNHLLRKGVTPSFSFPLDCAVFEVKGMSNWKTKIWASTQQDLRVALSEFSPKKIIMINKVEYEIGGLYFVMPPTNLGYPYDVDYAKHILDEENRDKYLKWYNYCDNEGCGWVHRDTEKKCETVICPVCQESDDDGQGTIRSKRFIQPEGFAPILVPWWKDKPQDGRNDKIRSREREMKAKIPGKERDTEAVGRVDLPAPLLDETEDGLEKVNGISKVKNFPYKARLEMRGSTTEGMNSGIQMIQVNTGFNGVGYYICEKCGMVEPGAATSFSNNHHRPYAIHLDNKNSSAKSKEEAKQGCKGSPVGGPVGATAETLYLGMIFNSDIVTFRFKISDPLQDADVLVVSREFNSALVAIKEALITEVQSHFKYVNREIGGGVRKFAIRKPNSDNEYFVEIFLYDQVSGGAGLVTEIKNNLDSLSDIFSKIEYRLSGKKCTNGKGCDKACVGCLLDFRNSREHRMIDRIQGMRLLEYLKTGNAPVADWSNASQRKEGKSNQVQKLAKSLDRIDDRVKVISDLKNGFPELVIQVESNEYRIRPISSLSNPFSDPIATDYRSWNRSHALRPNHRLTYRNYEDLEREQIDLISVYARLKPTADDLV